MLFFIGLKALFTLLFALFALIYGLTYRFVGQKVNAVLKPAQDSGEKALVALIVKGKTEAPGVVILQKDSIVFVPIVGRLMEVGLDDITIVKEVCYFNGSLLIGEKASGLLIHETGDSPVPCQNHMPLISRHGYRKIK